MGTYLSIQKLTILSGLMTSLSGCLGTGLFPVDATPTPSSSLGTGSVRSAMVPTNLLVSPASPSMNPVAVISGRTVPGCSVQVYSSDDCTGTVVGTAQADSNGNFSVTTLSMSDGTYNFTARCTQAGAWACSAEDLPWILETVAPTISISLPSLSLVNRLTPVNYIATYTDATRISLRGQDITLATTGTATCSLTISGSGNSTREITLSNCTGDGTVGFSIGAGTANDQPGNLADASGASALIRVDNTGFTSGVFTPAAGDYQTIPSLVTFNVPESLSASSVSPSDFILSGSCPGVAISSASVSGGSVFLALSGTGSCSLLSTLQISTQLSSMDDAAGNPGTGSSSVLYRMNNVGPTAATFSVPAGTYNPLPSQVAVTYNTSIDATTVSAADFSLSGTCTGASVSNVAISGSIATLQLANLGSCTNGQTVILTANFPGVKDASGNSGNGSAAATYQLDTVGPTASISPATGTVILMPSTVNVTFASDTNMSTVSAANFSLSGSCSVALSSVSTSGQVATLHLSGTLLCLLNNTVIITTNLATIRDLTGNPGVGTLSTTYTLDNLGPQASLSISNGTLANFPGSVNITYSGDTDMSTVTLSTIAVGGTCSGISVSSFVKSGAVATVNLSGTANCNDGDTLSIAATLGGVKDTIGNSGSGSVSAVVTQDHASPSAVVSPASAAFNPVPNTATVTFSNNTNMSTVSASTFNLTGSSCLTASISSVTKSGQVATVSFNGTLLCLNNQTVQLNTVMNGVSTGTNVSGSGTLTTLYTLDTVGPTSILGVNVGPVNPLPTMVAVNFSADTDMSSVTPSSFSLAGSSCGSVAISSITKTGQTAIVNLSGTTSCLSLQTMVLNTLLSTIHDQAGNYGIGTSLALFIYDNVAPSVGVAVNVGLLSPALPTDLSLTFSADTDMTSVNAANFTLLGTCTTPRIGSITYVGNIATVHITGTTSCGALSTMILSTNLLGIKDTAGNLAVGLQTSVFVQGL